MSDSTPNTFPPISVEPAKRTKARDSLFLVAGLRIDGRPGTLQVRVRNLSPGGLMAEYPHPVEIGCALEIELRGIGKVLGQVAWTAAGRIGIAFDNPIDPLQARKPVVSDKAPAKDKPIKPMF
ncbi:PilZ domain-containing protein [Sphingomonas panacisoli]|uniref:PilZ domain-containing protein n=1 Tax=Sphingomonas panacisoli TaxID=1813879 RepID=A0A5B8LKM9_9SPHN|nr:PilZ domain-containing protein [Sphingomonas panacisoli]QDZ07650.1 PilZ domain-containing protein [Sphingomonas panacisoli]